MQTIRVNYNNRFHQIPLLTDSEVFQSGNGYERIMIVNGWNDGAMNAMAQIHIRVDKNPGESFAKVSAWTPNSGWQTLITTAPQDFWHDMPGYLRWANDNSDSKTQRLASDLIAELIDLAENFSTSA